jgi:Flp pilus assembly protein TadD
MSRRSKKRVSNRAANIAAPGNTHAAAPVAVEEARGRGPVAGSSVATRQGPWASSAREWSFAALLFVAVLIAYQPVWRAGFIWDDDAHLTANPCIVGPLGFRAIWTSAAAVYYPLVLTTFRLEHALWGLDSMPYHLVNIGMHGACAILLWRVLLALKVRGAWLGAALWALHPVMVESVAWITELKNTQSCLFYLLAILFFLNWRQRYAGNGVASGASGYYALALLCGTLAILSKSSTVMLPVVLGLCVWWRERSWTWRVAGWLIPFVLVSVVASAWTVWEQRFHSGAQGQSWEQSWPERAVIAGKAIWFYLCKLAWPHPLIFIYPRWKIDAWRPLEWLPAVAAAAGLLMLWRGRNGRMRPVFFAAAYFVVSLFPVLGFFSVYFFRYSFVADHFQYLASMGPLALAGAGIERMCERPMKDRPLVAPGLCAALLGALGIISWLQSATYRDINTLWHTTIARDPGCWMAYTNLGMNSFQAGRTEEAIARFNQALELNPSDSEAHADLGVALAQQGRTGEAIVQYRQAVKVQPGYPEAHNDLGNALSGQGHTDEAIAEYREACRLKPDYADAYSDLGVALSKAGRMDEAMAEFHEALRINPALPDAHGNLGTALFQQGRTGEAVAEYREALRLNPDYAKGHYGLGNVLQQQGRSQEAVAEYREALRLDPGNAEAHTNLGVVLCQQGRIDEGIGEYRQALRIDPALADAHSNLGAALLQQGRTDEALSEYEEALRLNPQDAKAHANLGNILLRQGRTNEAITQYREALRINPGDFETHYNLGNALLRNGETGGAISEIEKALELQPANPAIENTLAWLLAAGPQASLRNGTRAVQLAAQASQATGGDKPAILRTLAAAYAQAGQYSNAVQTAQRALQLAQSNAPLASTLQREIKLYQAGQPFDGAH